MADIPSRPPSAWHPGTEVPNDTELYQCVQCGLCLQSCPTYVETGLETESPRGRIALMKAVTEGRLSVTPTVVRHWDLCVQCRACEAACPSGVPYGRLIEATMAQVQWHRRAGLLSRLVSALLLKMVLPNQRRLAVLVGALRLYQRSGLQRVVRRTRLLRLVSARVTAMERALPAIPSRSFGAVGQVIEAQGLARARVALLSGCIMPLVHGPQMEGVVRVLARNGCQVIVPQGQVCCGAVHTHTGDVEGARDLARRNIDVFLSSGVDTVVVASAGCGTRMKEYGHLLSEDPAYREKAHHFGGMVQDVHEFLVGLPLDPPRSKLSYRVTYQDPCHLANTQRIVWQPRALLSSIPGIDLVELPGASLCCGSGGTYALSQWEFSLRLLDAKMRAVRETGAEVIATANPGCLLQLQYGIARESLPLKVRYVTDLLDEAYQQEASPFATSRD